MEVGQLEQWLWDAACAIRGPLDAPKFKDYILPLVFLKRLSDVFDDEVELLGSEFGDPSAAASLVDQDHALVRFYLPELARWPSIARRTTGLGEHMTDGVRSIARENPRLQGAVQGRWHGKRGHLEHGLPGDSECLTARRQHGDGWAGAQDAIGQLGRGADHVLAVVEEDE